MESLEGRALLSAGDLDTAFGGTGVVTLTDLATGTLGNEYTAVVPSTDPSGNAGKIVVAGSGAGSFRVMRLNADGSPDATWGGSGVVTTAFGTQGSTATSVAIQPDGKVVVGGYTRALVQKGNKTYANDDFALVRYNPNGTLDTSFGQGGRVTTDFTPWDWKKTQADDHDVLRSLLVLPDGKILAGGNATTTVGAFGMARYNANGSLDTTFGTGGKVTTDLPGGLATIESLGLQTLNSTTRIIAIGPSGGYNAPAVVRYNLNGSVDSTFGSGGLASVPNLNALQGGGAIQPDGSILAAGVFMATDPASKNLMAVARLTPGGQPDTSFNGNGLATAAFPDHAGAMAMALQPNGSIVLGGSARLTTPSPHSVAALARFTPSGQLDTTFNGTGEVISEAIEAQITGLALQPDGKIVALGQGAYNSSLLIRYLGDAAATATTLASSLASAAPGDAVTFTATVAAAGTLPPGGTVAFYDGDTLLGTGTLVVVNGVATASFTTSTLAVGTHKIRAVYGGSTTCLGSISSELTLPVG